MHLRNILWIILCIPTGFVHSQHTIPWATQQPAWVFPIWITNGDGQKDTIYMALDSSANLVGQDDTLLGEISITNDELFTLFDTATTFHVILGSNNHEAIVMNKILLAGEFYFINGMYPIKLEWDKTMFQVPKPFETLTDWPIQFDVHQNGDIMQLDDGEPVGHYVIVYTWTDTCGTWPNANEPQPYCANDSMVILAWGGFDFYFLITMMPWTGYYVATDDASKVDGLKVHPNPANLSVTITVPNGLSTKQAAVSFSNMLGQVFLVPTATQDVDIQADVSSLPSGLYFCAVSVGSKKWVQKVVIAQ